MLFILTKILVCVLILAILYFSKKRIGFKVAWILLSALFATLSIGSDVTIWEMIVVGFFATMAAWLFMSFFRAFQQLRLKNESNKEAKSQEQSQ